MTAHEWRARLDRAVAETLRRRQSRAAIRRDLDARRQAGLEARHATKLRRARAGDTTEGTRMTDTTTPIVVRPLPGNMTTRWNCSLCPGGTDKTDAPFGFVDEDGKEHFVCEPCVRDMRNGTLAKSLAKEAQKLRERADEMQKAAEMQIWVVEYTAEPTRAAGMAEAHGCDPSAWDFVEYTGGPMSSSAPADSPF